MTCCVCHAPCVEPLSVGDIIGFRADDVVCSVECEDVAICDTHADDCDCNVCWRVARRAAHSRITQYRKDHQVLWDGE